MILRRHNFTLTAAALLVIGLGWFGLSNKVQAAVFSVTPVVFNEQTHDRDIIKDHITVHNTTSRALFVYTSVNDVSDSGVVKPATDPALANRSDTLSSWISISRGFQLSPGETKNLDLRIAVNLDAKPGVYHAQMIFTEGATQAEAENNKAQGVKAQVNVTVLDSSKEQSDLLRFIQDKSVFLKSQASFSYTIKNSGDLPTTPGGEISLYNRGGEEVATLPINESQVTIAPGETVTLHSVWSHASGVGRYKAIIRLKYGEKQPQILTDVVFFTLLPWPLLLALIGFLFLLVFALVYIINRHETRNRLLQEARFEELLALSKRRPPSKRPTVKTRKAGA